MNNLTKGLLFVRSNPQIVYTLLLFALVSVAFYLSGQQFLGVSIDNLERLEKEQIGLLQDTFVGFARDRLDNPDYLKTRIREIASENANIKEFKVAAYRDGAIQVVASLEAEDVGKSDMPNDQYYRSVALDPKTSIIFQTSESDGRHWRAFRAIVDNNQNLIGILMTNISMASIDKLFTERIRNAYIFLVFILLIILILFLRHARIIDYTELYRQLKTIDTMKDDFISIASHELRAPLTAIMWQIDALAGKIAGPQDVAEIRSAADRLAKLIGDILDVSRIEQGRMKFEPKETNIPDLTASVLETFQIEADQKGLKFIYQKNSLPNINIDPDRLRQVITNLISNAIKYTPKGSVSVETYEKEKKVFIKVQDTGIGISAEDQRQLFKKFFRVKSDETRRVNGTGLGLWITQEITSAMRGSIEVESIKGVGSSFTVSFPLAA